LLQGQRLQSDLSTFLLRRRGGIRSSDSRSPAGKKTNGRAGDPAKASSPIKPILFAGNMTHVVIPWQV
jgi:hypothetical protein